MLLTFGAGCALSDADGQPSAGWIGNEWVSTHAIFIDHEDNLWLVDHVGHTITKASKTGKREMILCPHGVIRRTDEDIAEVIGVGCEPSETQSQARSPPLPSPTFSPPCCCCCWRRWRCCVCLCMLLRCVC